MHVLYIFESLISQYGFIMQAYNTFLCAAESLGIRLHVPLNEVIIAVTLTQCVIICTV